MKDSGGDGAGPTPQTCNPTRFLKLGLAASVVFNFLWVGTQLSSLSAHDAASEAALVAPEYAPDGRDLYAASAAPPGHRAWRRPALPSHPTPNADLQDLVGSRARHDGCPPGLVYVADHMLADNVTHPAGRRIPRLLHVTTKSRCMTPAFANSVNSWKAVLGGTYSVYVHDDAAVNKFIYQKRWTEFPELKEVMSCITAGAAKADIWRYVMLWEYGGIYSDIDSRARRFDASSIAPEDDAFFVVEYLGIPAQYWFAASPRHPVMYLSAKQALATQAFRPDIANNMPARTTGPAGFKTGYILFGQFRGEATANGYLGAGLYVGAHGRSVRVVGKREDANEWVDREAVKAKGGNYAAMGMTRFHDTLGKYKEQNPERPRVGCLDQRYKIQVEFAAKWDNII